VQKIGGLILLDKINQVRRLFEKFGIDGLLVTNELNRRYLTEFTGSAGVVLITQQEALFLTDFRYDKQAREQIKGYEINIHQSSRFLMDNIIQNVNKLGIKKLGFEAGDMTFNFYSELKNAIGVNLVPTTKVVEKLRLVKTESEVEKIRKAAKIGDAAFNHIQSIIRPGVTELDVAIELEHFMKKQGASGNSSHSLIVDSGNRGALPHGVASDKVIESGDMVTLDYGALYEGYRSDMTRTLAVGTPDTKLAEIYTIVYDALQLTLETIKAGMSANEIDAIARDYIAGKGYGQYFGHGLGHGIGLDIHEDPFFSNNSTEELHPGMIVTIEPGIYIPELGGVRIEDDILVKENEIEILTLSPKQLIRL
jgi:Xaa-Pro aminopeptidase